MKLFFHWLIAALAIGIAAYLVPGASITLLGALVNIGILAANGADIGPMLVRDRVSGTCIYTAGNCWVSEWPTVSYDNKVTMRNWTLECDDLVRVDTGS